VLVFSNSADQDQGLLLKNIIVLFFSQKNGFVELDEKRLIQIKMLLKDTADQYLYCTLLHVSAS